MTVRLPPPLCTVKAGELEIATRGNGAEPAPEGTAKTRSGNALPAGWMDPREATLKYWIAAGRLGIATSTTGVPREKSPLPSPSATAPLPNTRSGTPSELASVTTAFPAGGCALAAPACSIVLMVESISVPNVPSPLPGRKIIRER